MVKVIEKAGQAPVPADLLEMCTQFKSKVAKGEAHWSSSGFVGKGFTFDSSEMNETQKIASMQRRWVEKFFHLPSVICHIIVYGLLSH